MKFNLSFPIATPVDRATEVLSDPTFLTQPRGDAPIGNPAVVSAEESDDLVEIAIRWFFIGDLNAAARAILDPAKLSWVQQSRHELSTHRATFKLIPDHYQDRLQCSGRYLVRPVDKADNSELLVRGEIKVRALLVAGQVEQVLVDGLSEVLAAQAAAVASWDG